MIVKLLLLLIRLYQLTISPLLGPVCRFEPSCSRYAAACLRDHGLIRGTWLSIKRLSKCHPFHPGGYDPPPLPAADLPAQLPTELSAELAAHCHSQSSESSESSS